LNLQPTKRENWEKKPSHWEKDLSFGKKFARSVKRILETKDMILRVDLMQNGKGLDFFFDKYASIDGIIRCKDGRTVKIAIKGRRLEMMELWGCDVTIEYKDMDIRTGEWREGDWFRFKKGIVDYYFYGYGEEVGDHVVIRELYVFKAKELTEVPGWREKTNRLHGRARFKYNSITKILSEHNEIVKKLISTPDSKK